jgi:hypothetical protein
MIPVFHRDQIGGSDIIERRGTSALRSDEIAAAYADAIAGGYFFRVPRS